MSKQALASSRALGLARPTSSDASSHQTPRYEPRLAPRQHTRQIVYGGIGVTAAHRLYEGRNDVVVLLAVLVVEGDVLLQARGDVAVGDLNVARRGAATMSSMLSSLRASPPAKRNSASVSVTLTLRLGSSSSTVMARLSSVDNSSSVIGLRI